MGERKLMKHFVVQCLFLLWLRLRHAGSFVIKLLFLFWLQL
jgi:hypothetical protein